MYAARELAIRTRAFQLRDIRRQAEKQDEMAAGAAAHRANAIRVDPVSVRIGSQEAHGGFHIFNGGRELMSRRQPVA